MLVQLITGFLAGVVSGLGIGGGAVLIPALTILLGMGQREAQHINLLYFIPTAAVAVFTHAKQGNIVREGLLKLTLFGLAGVAAGGFLAMQLNAAWLRKGFGVFLLVLCVYEFFYTDNKNGSGHKNKVE